jgi:hypothetical protein
MYTKHSVAVLTSIILGTCSFSASAAVDENICQLIGGPPTVELLAPNPPRAFLPALLNRCQAMLEGVHVAWRSASAFDSTFAWNA